jgi:membrane protein implicated in regulation of membrane protease activity
MKKSIGWILLVIGIGGIIVNLIFVFSTGQSTWSLVINTIVCLLFVVGGWQFSHPKEERGGQLKL